MGFSRSIYFLGGERYTSTCEINEVDPAKLWRVLPSSHISCCGLVESSVLLDNWVLIRNSVVAIFATTAAYGKRSNLNDYNPDVIISVGYRDEALRGKEVQAHERIGYSLSEF